MSNFFLLSSNVNTDPYPVYPLGMAVVATALVNAGHRVWQYDHLAAGCSDHELRKALKEFAPDFVGISLRNIDNVDSFSAKKEWYLTKIKMLVEIIRQETAVPIIVGGPGFSILPEEIINYIDADYGVVGEGERTLCDLITKLEAGHFAPRIIKNNKNLLTGSEMASPRWDKDLVNFYFKRSGMINLQTKRGCPYNCNYCTYPILEGRRLRTKEPEKVVEEIKQAKEMFGIDTIFFADSIFNDKSDHYLILAEAFLKQELDMRWYGFFRPQGIRTKELNLLKRSGLSAMEVGTDAACDVILAGLNKQFTFEDVIEFNRACVKEEIPTAHFIMFGGPNETMATVKEGLKNIQRLKRCVVFAFGGIRIHPGTQIHARAIQEGILNQKDALLKPVYYFSPNLDQAIMNENITSAFHGRRDRIFPPSEGLIRMATMNRFGYRGLLWDKLVSFKSTQNKNLRGHQQQDLE
ncbi:MAG: lipid biosynthesis B12-binding/radical SAM protein [Desulfobacterales bacterium]|jgi:lipid biosynthesis B12-binding/radical SAM protein|nr:lipid biosynthesis B12-binding/radical SAM protein [Desulfobacterales bacterium]